MISASDAPRAPLIPPRSASVAISFAFYPIQFVQLQLFFFDPVIYAN